MISNKRGFTLVELLVVVGMIAIILGSMTTSITAAQQRARVQKATSDVKVISQAILGSENFGGSGGEYELPTLTDADADQGNLGFLLGKGGGGKGTLSGEKIPALLMAQLNNNGAMTDPWGTPYKVTIRQGSGQIKMSTAAGSMQTGYFLPNFYRLGITERDL